MSDALPRTLETPSAERRLDRRQLVKAGVWAAPAVVLATAVPAATASGALSLTFSAQPSLNYTWSNTAVTGLAGSLPSLQLSGSTGRPSRVTNFIVTVTVDGTDIATPSAPVITAGTGWSAGTVSVSGGRTSFTFTNGTESTVATGATVPVPALSFTLAGGAAFTATSPRAWTVSASATATTANTSVGTASASGASVALALPITVSAPTASPVTVGNGQSAKGVSIAFTAAASTSVVARLVVTYKHNSDGFVTTSPFGGSAAGTPSTNIQNHTNQGLTDVATTRSMAAGALNVTFPTYAKQSANTDGRPYRIEFLLGGATTPFAPATIAGTL